MIDKTQMIYYLLCLYLTDNNTNNTADDTGNVLYYKYVVNK
jgi:hypothetical protein